MKPSLILVSLTFEKTSEGSKLSPTPANVVALRKSLRVDSVIRVMGVMRFKFKS